MVVLEVNKQCQYSSGGCNGRMIMGVESGGGGAWLQYNGVIGGGGGNGCHDLTHLYA